MLNKVILIGNLGADPETRHLPSGGQIVTVRLATTRKWKDKQTNERKEDTEWHRVVFFNRLAETVGNYLKKGSQIYVEGRIRTQKYQKNGEDRYSTEIIGEEMHMLGSKGENAGNRNFGGSTQGGQSAPPSSGYGDDDYDDDIPF